MFAFATWARAADRTQLTSVGRQPGRRTGAGGATAGAGHPGRGRRTQRSEPELTDRESTDRRVASPFAEQFVVDVASVSDAERQAPGQPVRGGDLPAGPGDLGGGLRLASGRPWDQLFADVESTSAGAPRTPATRRITRPPTTATGTLWPLLESFLAAVARLDHLDPVTTELVRLRGARSHNCRLCRSRRYVRALRGRRRRVHVRPDRRLRAQRAARAPQGGVAPDRRHGVDADGLARRPGRPGAPLVRSGRGRRAGAGRGPQLGQQDRGGAWAPTRPRWPTASSSSTTSRPTAS